LHTNSWTEKVITYVVWDYLCGMDPCFLSTSMLCFSATQQ